MVQGLVAVLRWARAMGSHSPCPYLVGRNDEPCGRPTQRGTTYCERHA